MDVGSVRPGGRTARTRAAVLAALRVELVASGYSDLSIERVAERAGVHKTTIYRRWGDRAGLMSDLLELMASGIEVDEGTGELEHDLTQFAHSLVDVLSGDSATTVLAILSAAADDAEFAVQLREFYRARYAAVEPLVARAIARGELAADTSAELVVLHTAAPLYYRLVVLRENPTRSDADRAVAAALAAAAAGTLHVERG